MAAAEKSKHCIAFSSGSAATSAVIHLLSLLSSSDNNHSTEKRRRILCIDDVYGGTQRYFRKIVQPTMNIDVDFLDFDDLSMLEKQIRDSNIANNNDHDQDHPALKKNATLTTTLLWLETPTNPTLKVSKLIWHNVSQIDAFFSFL